ncbi:MAG: hypothetical protein M3N47_04795 [Chloroflexota bacterium]|nr:hypothetical protein [Chloroflexota bacterium]
MSPAPSYEGVRDAQVVEEPKWEEFSFVLLGIWHYIDGRDEWCLEYIDAMHGPVRDDDCFDSERGAVTAAEREFGVTGSDWRDGYPVL